MKGILIISLFFLVLSAISAQTYFPFIEQGKIWTDITTYENILNGNVHIWTDDYKFLGDTMINGKIYHNLYSCYMDSSMTDWIRENHFYREDSNKVYRWNEIFWEEDILLYDFNLQVGDSLECECPTGYTYVTAIDSTLICGYYRKTIHLTLDKWIEGIGSVHSTFNPISYFNVIPNQFYLQCVTDTICQLYQNQSFPGCYVDTLILYQNEKSVNNPALSVSPNPVNTTSTISISNTTKHINTIQLFDSLGRIVRNETSNDNSFGFNRNDLLSGIYFLTVSFNNLILTKRIIIN